MQTLPIYFHKTVEGVARAGDIKVVAASYAKNVLFPRKLGEVATDAVRARAEKEAKKHSAATMKQGQHTEHIAAALADVVISVPGKAGEDGTLYAAIHPKDIVAAAKTKHIALQEDWIVISDPVKRTGTHQLSIHIGKQKMPLNIIVEAE